MFQPVMVEMAALAQRFEVPRPTVAWIMVEMRRGQNNQPDAASRIGLDIRPGCVPAAIIAPSAG
jgi:hypothetical protein